MPRLLPPLSTAARTPYNTLIWVFSASPDAVCSVLLLTDFVTIEMARVFFNVPCWLRPFCHARVFVPWEYIVPV